MNGPINAPTAVCPIPFLLFNALRTSGNLLMTITLVQINNAPIIMRTNVTDNGFIIMLGSSHIPFLAKTRPIPWHIAPMNARNTPQVFNFFEMGFSSEFSSFSSITTITPISVTAIPVMISGERISPSIKYAPNAAKIGDRDIIKTERLGPIITNAANNPKSPIPRPTIPLKPIQNHCSLLAVGNRLPRNMICVIPKRQTAISIRYALTLSEPIFLPADANSIELIVQRPAVTIAAVSPMRFGSMLFTDMER